LPISNINPKKSPAYCLPLQPPPGEFAYDEAAYKKALGQFIDAVSSAKPVTLVVQVLRKQGIAPESFNRALLSSLLRDQNLSSPVRHYSRTFSTLSAFVDRVAAEGTSFVTIAAQGLGSWCSASRQQGYITAQYALLWAAENPEKVDKLVMLNMPLSPKSALPPYLAPYKNPIAFMRPKVRDSAAFRMQQR
jgi:pimeloyl-ACP methyl ester carboxylesterase